MLKYKQDIELAIACTENNEKAWSKLIATYRNDCVIIARKLNVSYYFDDVFSEFILKLLGKPGEVKGALERYDGSTSLRTYLSVIFSRVVLSYLRKRKTRGFVIFSDKFEKLYKPKKPELMENDCNDELTDAIAMLSANEKNLIQLYYYQKLKLRQIAEIFQCSDSKISRQFKKIHAKLKKLLQEN